MPRRQVQLRAPPFIIAGDPTQLLIEGAHPGETIRVHAFRRTATVSFEGGQRVERPVTTHGWADYRADEKGRVALEMARTSRTAYRKAGRDSLVETAERPDAGHRILRHGRRDGAAGRQGRGADRAGRWQRFPEEVGVAAPAFVSPRKG